MHDEIMDENAKNMNELEGSLILTVSNISKAK
jgi:hypothetical protein